MPSKCGNCSQPYHLSIHRYVVPKHFTRLSLLLLFMESAMLIFILSPAAVRGNNLTLGASSPLPIVPLCLLRCKDNHMLRMDNEWSADFVFPLSGMLRTDESREVINRRVKSICEQNAELLDCLSACPGSVEKQILQMGLQPWEGICSNLRVLSTQIGCWKQNIEAITSECAFESQQLRHSTELLTRNVSVALVESICEHLRHLSVCFVAEYGKHCGQVSQQLVSTLFETSREVIAQMLRVKWADLPGKCKPEPLILEPVPFGMNANTSGNNSEALIYNLLFTIFSIFLNFIDFFKYKIE